MGNLTTRGLRRSDGPNLSQGFHHGKSQTLVTRTSEFAIPDSPKWAILRHVASIVQTVQIYPGAFAPINWGFNPWVTPERSNGCRVFQPRSDGSDKFLTCAFSHDFLVMEKSTVQMFSWTLRIYDPDLFANHEDIEKPSGKAFNTLLSPTNLMAGCDRRFLDGILFFDQHLFRVKVLNLPASSSDMTVVSDHRSPDGISSIDSILHPYASILSFQEDRSSSYRVTKALRLHILFSSS
jgi:hypothetical protein